jgi:hypothetical protein
LLVGLLMPAIQRVKESAKNVKCMSNLRQISMATFVYAADNNGFAPGDSYVVNAYNEFFVSRSHNEKDPTYKSYYPKNKWFAEYLSGSGGMVGKMNPIAYCPKGGLLGEIGPNVPKAPYFNFSYGMNPSLFEDWWITNENPDRCSVPLAEIKNPAKVCLWIESNRNKTSITTEAITGRHFSHSKKPALTPGPVVGTYPVYQYQGRVNVVYVDQHLSSFNIPEQVPFWGCSFWDHSRKQRCDQGICSYCDGGLK